MSSWIENVMAQCPICNKDIKLSLDKMIKPIDCTYCDSGPFRVKRTSGYFFAFGLVLYFIFAVVVGVVILGVDPSSMFVHVHNSGSEGGLSSLLFFVGFFGWVKIWGDIWSKKYAKLVDGS